MRKLVLLSILFSVFSFSCSDDDRISKIESSGTIESKDVVVSSKNSGLILKINFDEGNKVKAGDTILVIEHEQLELQLSQAIALKNAAEAQYELMKKGAREEDIVQAEQNLNQAKINYESAERDKQRLEKLIESNTVSQKQFEDAVSRFELTKAQFLTAKENLNKVRKIFRNEEIKSAKANYDKAIAGVELIKKNIKDCHVTTPIDGFISKMYVENGELVSPMTSLFKVVNLEKLELMIYVSTEELAYVKLGQKVDIKIDAFKDKVYNGKVAFISPEAEFTPKNIQTKDERTKLVYAVKINVENKNYELKSGMPADAVIMLED